MNTTEIVWPQEVHLESTAQLPAPMLSAPLDWPVECFTQALGCREVNRKALLKRQKNADPKIKKRIVQTLFEEILISPKEGDPWETTLEIRGAYLLLTGVFVASPTGFEPVLPT